MDFRLFREEDLQELRSVSELDSAVLKSIQDAYFKGTVVRSIIALIIPAAVVALWFAGVIQTFYGTSDVVKYVLILLVAICTVEMMYQIYRIVFSSIFFSKIKSQSFTWAEGTINGRQMKWPGTYGRKNRYYSVDDKFFAQTQFNPSYRKGTTVYFLYFTGLSERPGIGGAVVRIKD